MSASTPPHVFTTSYFTHEPIAKHLENRDNYGFDGLLRLSPGRAVGLRMVPTERDLRFAWEELPQQMLDEAGPEGARQPAYGADRLGPRQR